MESGGHEVSHYNGRFFYSGPSVRIDHDELQDVILATKVMLQVDQLGKGLIVYPKYLGLIE